LSDLDETPDLEDAPGETSTWEQWKASLAAFIEAVASLAALRWDMARSEAKDWARAALLRVAFGAAAAVFALLSIVFLAVVLVLLLQLWLGSLLAAVAVVFGFCLLAAGGLAIAATRGRSSRPMFERTAGEIRKDFESWTGRKP
jgi:hypothetical protein